MESVRCGIGLFVRLWFGLIIAVGSVQSTGAQAEDEANVQTIRYPVSVDDGSIQEWQQYGGRWKIRSEALAVRTSGPAKAVIANLDRSDFELEAELRAAADSQAGVIFRVHEPASGVDDYRGYYVGIHADRNRFIWGAANRRWRRIADRSADVPNDTWFHLRLRVDGSNVKAWLSRKKIRDDSLPTFDGVDTEFRQGALGLRCLGQGAEFRNLRIRALPSRPVQASYTNPVQSGCADPAVLLHDGVYYAYCTHSPDHPDMVRGLRLHTSVDLVKWKDRGFVVTPRNSWGKNRFWAPDIIRHAGEFYLYYAVETRICVARASHPAGPFHMLGDGPMLPESVRIDAHVFRDSDERVYFYFVTFNRGNEIWAGELNPDMISLRKDSLKRQIIADQPWEQHRGRIVEGPAVLKRNGLYYLTYSGSHFESPEYAVGYAVSRHPLGPWKKYVHNPIMKSTSYAHGTAHHGFTTSPDGREIFMVYHRHFSLEETEPRALAIDRVRFVEQTDGVPILKVHGPTASPQPLPSGTVKPSEKSVHP